MLVARPWGTYEVLRPQCEGDRFLLKKIMVKPGHRLSLQSHNHRSEHWVVIEGAGEVTVGEDEIVCAHNTHIFVPRGTKHRIRNTSVDSPLVFVEVQVGKQLDEDDIIRYQDDYQRA